MYVRSYVGVNARATLFVSVFNYALISVVCVVSALCIYVCVYVFIGVCMSVCLYG